MTTLYHTYQANVVMTHMSLEHRDSIAHDPQTKLHPMVVFSYDYPLPHIPGKCSDEHTSLEHRDSVACDPQTKLHPVMVFGFEQLHTIEIQPAEITRKEITTCRASNYHFTKPETSEQRPPLWQVFWPL